MVRRIIEIDSEKCNGCGACADACHEGAIGMINGKATLLRDDYCDGLGDCLPTCPTGAITFVEREALAYDEAAVKAAQAKRHGSSCVDAKSFEKALNSPSTAICDSQLKQWPVQIKLIAPNSAFFNCADILIAADCTAYAYGNFHQEFIKDRITLIGCTKLDATDYSEKLTEIFKTNDIKSVTVTRMQVPCCGGIEMAVKRAIAQSGKNIPLSVVTIAADGKIVNRA